MNLAYFCPLTLFRDWVRVAFNRHCPARLSNILFAHRGHFVAGCFLFLVYSHTVRPPFYMVIFRRQTSRMMLHKMHGEAWPIVCHPLHTGGWCPSWLLHTINDCSIYESPLLAAKIPLIIVSCWCAASNILIAAFSYHASTVSVSNYFIIIGIVVVTIKHPLTISARFDTSCSSTVSIIPTNRCPYP